MFCVFPRNLRLQALREMDESLREALDTAKTEASQSTAALAQAQARETILAADVECKVMACAAAAPASWSPHAIPPPPPLPLVQAGLITRFFINEHAATQRQPKVEAKKVGQHAAAAACGVPNCICCVA